MCWIVHAKSCSPIVFGDGPDSFPEQDFLPLADRAQSDILQHISTSYERILTKFFDAVGRGPVTGGLDFGGHADQDSDPEFLNLDQVKCHGRHECTLASASAVVTNTLLHGSELLNAAIEPTLSDKDHLS